MSKTVKDVAVDLINQLVEKDGEIFLLKQNVRKLKIELAKKEAEKEFWRNIVIAIGEAK